MKVEPNFGGNSNAEDKIRKKLREFDLSSSKHEIALWSLHVPNHEKKEFSETDFIILTSSGLIYFKLLGSGLSSLSA